MPVTKTESIIRELKNGIASGLLGRTGDDDVILTEIGGTVGDMESQPFIEAALEHAACCIVYEDVNEDGYFTDYCSAQNIPLITMAKSSSPLSNLSHTSVMFPL